MNIYATKKYCASVTSYKYQITGNESDVKCASYDGSGTYSCVGNRPPYYGYTWQQQRRAAQNHYPYFQRGKSDTQYKKDPVNEVGVVKHGDIDNIMSDRPLEGGVKQELNQRRMHVWYQGVEAYNPTIKRTGDLVDHVDQNRMRSVLMQLKEIIEDRGDHIVDEFNTSSKSVAKGQLIETKNLKNVESDLYSTNYDCICYSDCISYKMGSQQVCVCFVHCGCNYGIYHV